MGKYSDDLIRPFTEKNKRHSSFCIYCGKNADTREHVPSKVFIDEPYEEDDFSIVPACFDCNNNYSHDEIYVASLVNKAYCAVSGNNSLRKKIILALEHDKKLNEKLCEQVQVVNNSVNISLDAERVRRILLKLALGHIASKLDVIFDADSHTLSCEFCFKPQLSQCEYIAFEQPPIVNKVSEAGADYVQDILVFINNSTGEQFPISPWQVVQENNYRFLVHVGDDCSYLVRIVIMETLYAEVIISDKDKNNTSSV